MRTTRATWLLLLPAIAIFASIFAAPLVYFFIVSFWLKEEFVMVPAATLANYAQVFDEFWLPLLFTFGMATLIALATTVLAFAFAYVVRFKAGRYAIPLLFVALITLFGGYLTKVYVWKTILGEQGILNSALLALGLIDQPMSTFLYNPVAVVITLTHYNLPLAVLPIYGALRSVDDVPLRSARDLGAGPFRGLWDIVLPQCRTGLVIAFSLTFLFTAGDWITPKLVGGPYTSMIGTFIEFQYGSLFNRPLGSAMAFTVIAISVAILGCFAALAQLTLRPR
jgi:spermidine/putrescine transport system permease protein